MNDLTVWKVLSGVMAVGFIIMCIVAATTVKHADRARHVIHDQCVLTNNVMSTANECFRLLEECAQQPPHSIGRLNNITCEFSS